MKKKKKFLQHRTKKENIQFFSLQIKKIISNNIFLWLLRFHSFVFDFCYFFTCNLLRISSAVIFSILFYLDCCWGEKKKKKRLNQFPKGDLFTLSQVKIMQGNNHYWAIKAGNFFWSIFGFNFQFKIIFNYFV